MIRCVSCAGFISDVLNATDAWAKSLDSQNTQRQNLHTYYWYWHVSIKRGFRDGRSFLEPRISDLFQSKWFWWSHVAVNFKCWFFFTQQHFTWKKNISTILNICHVFQIVCDIQKRNRPAKVKLLKYLCRNSLEMLIKWSFFVN